MNLKLKLRLVFAESILSTSGACISIPIMVLFYNSIGMNQTLIGISQMVFAAAVLCADIPMGYLADKFSRRALNIAGDFAVAGLFILYALSQNFWMIVVAEILIGIALGATNGVDDAFIKFYSDRIDGASFKKNIARLKFYQFITSLGLILLGMVISRYSLRLTIGAVAVPFFVAGVLSCFIDDIGDKITTARTSVKDMIGVLRDILRHKKVRWLIAAFAVSRDITHPVIWVFTPLLILAGVPLYLVGIGWFFNYIFGALGTLLARRMAKCRPSVQFITPIIIVTAGLSAIIVNVNIVTVWLFACVGMSHGYASVAMSPLIQQETEDKYQTTVVSIAATSARLLYVPTVAITNWAGSYNPVYTLVATLLIFLPFAAFVYIGLRRVLT